MKLTTMTAAAALALAAPAYAYTGVSPSMLSSVENILLESGLDVDMTTLTDEQVVEIFAAGQQADANDQINMIKAALDADNYSSRAITERRVILTERDATTGLEPAGEASVVASVQNYLDANSFDVDASTLTDAQVAEIYFLAFGQEQNQTNRDEVETILNM